MSRKKRVRRNSITYPEGSKLHFADYVYGREDIAKFINYIMRDGKKSVAENIVYTSLGNVAAALKVAEVEVFTGAINNIAPTVELKSQRFGGATYQVPIEVERSRGVALAMKWLVTFARKTGGRSMIERLSDELRLAYLNDPSSKVLKKSEEVRKMAEANRAYSHLEQRRRRAATSAPAAG